MELTEERFRALARSSPWRWTTLRFTFRKPPSRQEVRAWLRRPDRLRIEDLDTGIATAVRGEADHRATWPPAVPVVDADGLVQARPQALGYDTDAPMHRDYLWVAMLDPVELADGADGPGTRLTELADVVHHGRPAWEAVAQPTVGYDPRCVCCSLLLCEDSFLGAKPPGFVMPESTRVRLDVETGVGVLSEQVGGSRAGHGHDVAIDAVDEPMPDELFGSNRRRRFRRVRRAWFSR